MLKTKRTRGEWRKKHSRRVATFGLKSRVFDGKLVTPEMPWFLGRVLNTSTRQPLPTPAQISSPIMYPLFLVLFSYVLRSLSTGGSYSLSTEVTTARPQGSNSAKPSVPRPGTKKVS